MSSSLGVSNPLIISASRRTDLPGFHPAACKERILSKMQRLRTRHLYGVVFWTRHVEPFLQGGPLHDLVRNHLDNPVVNLTITGHGGSVLEPGTPSTADTLKHLPALVHAFHDEPWRIRWRFDPLLRHFTTVAQFERIATVMSRLDIPTCTFSFPAYFSLKGDLTGAFEAAGIPRWEADEKRAFLVDLVAVATRLGIRLLSCAQPENTTLHPYIEPAQCIPRAVLEQGDPRGRPLTLEKDRSQRSKCRCITSEDIGDYETDRCLGGCVYCYSKAGGPLDRFADSETV